MQLEVTLTFLQKDFDALAHKKRQYAFYGFSERADRLCLRANQRTYWKNRLNMLPLFSKRELEGCFQRTCCKFSFVPYLVKRKARTIGPNKLTNLIRFLAFELHKN